MILRILFFIIFICSSGMSFAIKKRAFPLQEKQKKSLIFLLDEAVYLHKALYFQQQDKIHLSLLKMFNQIKVLENTFYFLPYQQQSYIHKLLQGLKPQLETIKNHQTTSKKSINSINRTFTYMAHVYGLKKYAVFFCPEDRSVWMQKKTVNRKSLHIDHQLCGSAIGK